MKEAVFKEKNYSINVHAKAGLKVGLSELSKVAHIFCFCFHRNYLKPLNKKTTSSILTTSYLKCFKCRSFSFQKKIGFFRSRNTVFNMEHSSSINLPSLAHSFLFVCLFFVFVFFAQEPTSAEVLAPVINSTGHCLVALFQLVFRYFAFGNNSSPLFSFS